MSIETMYTEVIMWHNKEGHNKHELVNPDYVERGHNPSCGDDLTLMVTLKDQVIKEAAFVGHGCAISTASISIMIDLLKGKTVEEAKRLVEGYLEMVRGHEVLPELLNQLEDAQLFSNLQNMPARVKCGTLGWHCMAVILQTV